MGKNTQEAIELWCVGGTSTRGIPMQWSLLDGRQVVLSLLVFSCSAW